MYFRSALRQMRRGWGTAAPSGGEVTPATQSFLVDPQRLTDCFLGIINRSDHLYVKGAVHEAKSSWAQSAAQLDPGRFFYFSCNQGQGNAEKMEEELVAAYARHVDHCKRYQLNVPKTKGGDRLTSIERVSDLKNLKSDFIVLLDECHQLFALPGNSNMFSTLVKRSGLSCKAGYLSTTQFGISSFGVATPPQVTNKYVLPWRFQRDEVRELVPCMLYNSITPGTACPIESADLLFGLLAGHRGMTVLTLEYIRESTVHQDPGQKMQFDAMHSRLCDMLKTDDKGANQSRAAKINGSSSKQFPRDYGHNMTSLIQYCLAKGMVPANFAQRAPGDVQFGVTIGALAPFDLWSTSEARDLADINNNDYCIPNPFLVRRLFGSFSREALLSFRHIPKPSLAVDAVLTGLSHMSYQAFFDVASSKNTTREGSVWYEDPVNAALQEGLNQAYAPLDNKKAFVPAAPSSKQLQGKPDLVGLGMKIENMVFNAMNSRKPMQQHYQRFSQMSEYKAATPQKQSLLIITCDPKEVAIVQQLAEQELLTDAKATIPVLIVAIDWKSLWSVGATYLEPPNGGKVRCTSQEIRLNCQSWKFDNGRFVVNTVVDAELRKKMDNLQEAVPDDPVWVIVHRQGMPDWSGDLQPKLKKAGYPGTVDGLLNTVYSMKEDLDQLEGTKLNRLKAYPSGCTDTAQWLPFGLPPKDDEGKHYPGKLGSPLVPASEEQPYIVVVG